MARCHSGESQIDGVPSVSNGIGSKAHQRSKTLFTKLTLPGLPIELKVQSPPKLEEIPVHDLPTTGPVADFFRHRKLPSSREDLSQVMRFCIRNKAGEKAAQLVTEFFAQGGDSALTLCLGYPPQGDEQGLLTDDDLKFLVSWINEWMPELPGEAFALDLSGNALTARGLERLDKCLKKNPRIQALDLSRNRFLVQPWLCKREPAEKKIRTLHRKLTSPRGEKTATAMLKVGEAIGSLLKSPHLQRLWLNGNPFSLAVRNCIIGAVEESPVLHALDMSGCALLESDVKKLLSLRSRHWSDLALGTKLTPGMVTAIAKLLSTTRDLHRLSLEISGPCSLIDVTDLFRALGSNHSLEVLSLAGLRLVVNPAVVADALRRNTCLHTLDLSRSEISEMLVDALVNALKWEKGSTANKTLTKLILPEFDPGTLDHDKEMNRAKLSFAISLNNRQISFKQLPGRGLATFIAACAPVADVPPELFSRIVDYMRAYECAPHTLAGLVREPVAPSAVRAPQATWQKARSPRDLKSPP